MQSITNLLQEDDPIDMVLNEIFSQYPELAEFPAGSFTVSKIKPSTGARNTEAVILGTPAVGVKGKLSIFYDRADLGKAFNTFGDKSINPELFIFADVGATLTLNDILPKLNAVLNLKLKTTGNWLDVQSVSFTAAAKGLATTITLNGKAGTADGSPPVSARVLPLKPFKIDIVNRGNGINNKMPSRSLNPFIKADGNLNWSGETIPVAAPKRSLLLALYATDFTDVFNAYSPSEWLYYSTYANPVHKWLFKVALSDAIKARCIELGYPVIDFTRAQQSGRTVSGQSVMETLVFKSTSAYASADHVNKKYTKAILLGDSFASVGSPVGTVSNIKPTIGSDIAWATTFTNYPIHFNAV